MEGAAQQAKGKVQKAWGNVEEAAHNTGMNADREREKEAERGNGNERTNVRARMSVSACTAVTNNLKLAGAFERTKSFDDDTKRGLQRHPAFLPTYNSSGPVPIIYGCGNCLIKRPVFTRFPSPAFDLRFNFLGGGDVDFFTRCRRGGMKFHWVAEAVIIETVPDVRTHPAWLALRGLRIGAINYHVQRKAALTPWLRARLLAKILALLPLSLVRAVRLLLTEHKALIALHPMIVAAGGALAAMGIEPQPYKASKIAF